MDVDMDQSTLSKIERTGPHLASRKRIAEIADELGCRVRIEFRDGTGSVLRHEALNASKTSLATIARRAATNGEIVAVEFEETRADD